MTVHLIAGEKAPTSPYLATLLEARREEITATWAEMVHALPGSRYQDYPVAELQRWLSPWLAVATDALATGSYEATEKHLQEITLARLQMGFDISEVMEALLLLREAVLPIYWQDPPGPLCEAPRTFIPFDYYLRHTIGRFGHLYAEAVDTEFRESEERFRALAEFTYDWEYWLDPDGTYKYVSPSCERITGYRADEFQQNPDLLEAIIHPEDRAIVTKHLREEPIEGSVVYPVDFRVIARNGKERWLEHVCQPVYGSEGRYLGRRGSNRDITERKRAEAALEEQAKTTAVAAERSRLARELHDSVTQALYSVTLYAEATRLALLAEKPDVAAENLRELHNMAREAMVDMRMLIFELHPPMLEEEGLVAALQARLAAVESRAGLETAIHVADERRLPIWVEGELFRIALEALNNVIKHANARKVEVALGFNDEGACLEIEDDGVGFDLETIGQRGGMGLPGMEERAQRIGGVLAIKSASGQGTVVKVKLLDTSCEKLDLET